MNTQNILIPAIVATTAMTLFSYLVSRAKNKNFREPEILGNMVERLPESGSNESSQVAGWATHYVAGIAFQVVYNKLWQHTKIKSNLPTGALLGAASGFAGILIWIGMFKAHPNPPAKNLKPYFRHLILAHVVFGVFSALAYREVGGDEDS